MTKRTNFQIELTYGGVHASYWMSSCALTGFTAVYLDYIGFSNTQIGVTSSLVYLFSVTLQILVADFSDKHFSVPLKAIIACMYAAAVLSAMFLWAPLPVAAMMLAFALAQAFLSSIDCFISASIMQFTNLGRPLTYGWPRSFGSVAYALLAFTLGILIEKHSPAFLIPLFMVLSVLGVVMILLIPRPEQYASPEALARYQNKENPVKISYREMLSGNPTLVLLLLAILLSSTGYSPSFMFAIRLFERMGGGAKNVGINSFFSASMELPALMLSLYLAKHFKIRTLVSASILFHFFRMLALVMIRTPVPAYVIACFQGLNNGIYLFATLEFANRIVRPGEQVRAQSLLAFSKTLGSVAGNAIAGRLIDAYGLDAMYLTGAGLCLLGGVLVLLCSRSYVRQFPDET